MPPEGFEHARYTFYAFFKPGAFDDACSRNRFLSSITTLGYPALSGSFSVIYFEIPSSMKAWTKPNDCLLTANLVTPA